MPNKPSADEPLFEASNSGLDGFDSATRVVLADVSPDLASRVVAALGQAEVLIVPRLSAVKRHWALLESFSPNVVVSGPAVLEILKRVPTVLGDDASTVEPPKPLGVSAEPNWAPGMPRLKHRQQQLLFLLSKGLNNKELAEQLSVSARAVKADLAQLYVIFDVSNRTELVGAAAELGAMATGSARER